MGLRLSIVEQYCEKTETPSCLRVLHLRSILHTPERRQHDDRLASHDILDLTGHSYWCFRRNPIQPHLKIVFDKCVEGHIYFFAFTQTVNFHFAIHNAVNLRYAYKKDIKVNNNHDQGAIKKIGAFARPAFSWPIWITAAKSAKLLKNTIQKNIFHFRRSNVSVRLVV